jgi:hypothetical protein
MQFFPEKMKLDTNVFVFLGEAGSGKSEIAVNWALAMSLAGKAVRFFDMDQTKPMFRSRETFPMLRAKGISINDYSQFMDAPVIPAAVFDTLCHYEGISILDIGGNAAGARCIGQFSEAWGKSVAAYLVMNSYRPFSASQNDLVRTVDEILAVSHLKQIRVISNPNLGEQTTPEDVVAGHRQLEELLAGTPLDIEFLVADRRLMQEVCQSFPTVPVFGISRFLAGSWEIKD